MIIIPYGRPAQIALFVVSSFDAMVLVACGSSGVAQAGYSVAAVGLVRSTADALLPASATERTNNDDDDATFHSGACVRA